MSSSDLAWCSFYNFSLRDGRSIRTVSALLLQLVQTSAHGVRISAKKLGKTRQQAVALKRHDSTTSDLPEPFLEDSDQDEIGLYLSGLESATKAAKTIVIFLTQRSRFRFLSTSMPITHFPFSDRGRERRQRTQTRRSIVSSSTISSPTCSLSSSGLNGPQRACCSPLSASSWYVKQRFGIMLTY